MDSMAPILTHGIPRKTTMPSWNPQLNRPILSIYGLIICDFSAKGRHRRYGTRLTFSAWACARSAASCHFESGLRRYERPRPDNYLRSRSRWPWDSPLCPFSYARPPEKMGLSQNNIVTAILFAYVGLSRAQSRTPHEYVNPLIGTINGGHVFPGATLPFGMAKAGPDVNGENQGGFASDDSPIIGFSHMHDSGTGGV